MVTIKDAYEIINQDELDYLKDNLKNWAGYIPLILIRYADNEYYTRRTDEARIQFQQKRQGVPGVHPEFEEYLIKDVLDWVKEFPQFERIILWEKLE